MAQKFVEKGKYVTFNFKPYEVEYIGKLNAAERDKKSIESDTFYQAIDHDRLVLPPQIKDIGYVEDEMNFLDYKLLVYFVDHRLCPPRARSYCCYRCKSKEPGITFQETRDAVSYTRRAYIIL